MCAHANARRTSNATLISTRKTESHVYWYNRLGNSLKSDYIPEPWRIVSVYRIQSNKRECLRSISSPLIEEKCKKCFHFFFVFDMTEKKTWPKAWKKNFRGFCRTKDDDVVGSRWNVLVRLFFLLFQWPVLYVRISQGNLLCNGINVCFTHSKLYNVYIPEAFWIKYYMLLTLNVNLCSVYIYDAFMSRTKCVYICMCVLCKALPNQSFAWEIGFGNATEVLFEFSIR